MSKHPTFVNSKPIGFSGDFEVIIGRSQRCNIHLSTDQVPGIARKHAILKRIRDRLFIQDLGSNIGTYLDDQKLPKRTWQEIIPKSGAQNQIRIGNTPIGIDAQLFRGRARVGIETTPLDYQVAGKKILNGAYVCAYPGTMTAIMGPAGCGKSTLLDLVNGYRKPTQGKIFITQQQQHIDLHQAYHQVREILGYLPQDDVMIPELTVYQSLYFSLKLRFPGLAATIRQHIIHQTCASLGFDVDRLPTFLNTVIGSSESGIRGLSGGERKRANLAHELVAMPLILFLDEPTSGLSSVDAEKIIHLLHMLTQRHELTVIATIHQPSRDAFKLFDNVLLMNHHGIVVYYGPTPAATLYFEQITQTSSTEHNPAEYLLEILDNPKHAPLFTQPFHTRITTSALGHSFHYISPVLTA